MRQGVVPLGVAFVLLVSGCIGSSGGSDQPAAPTAEFDEDTGAIEGTVINDENLPLPGAMVGIAALNLATNADEQGRYVLSHVPPGSHVVSADAIGYSTVARKVDVVAGQVSPLHFTLAADAVQVANFKMRPQVGNVQCTVRVYPGVPTTGAGGLPKWITGVAVCGVANLSLVLPLPPDKFLLSWPMEKNLNEILLEMEWKSTQMSGRGLSVVMEHAGMYNSIPNTWGQALGTSPLKMYANNTTMLKLRETSGKDCWSEKCRAETRVFGAANTTEFYLPVDPPELGPLGKPNRKVDYGFVIDQRFTQYVTQFFHMVKPEGYSALSDK